MTNATNGSEIALLPEPTSTKLVKHVSFASTPEIRDITPATSVELTEEEKQEETCNKNHIGDPIRIMRIYEPKPEKYEEVMERLVDFAETVGKEQGELCLKYEIYHTSDFRLISLEMYRHHAAAFAHIATQAYMELQTDLIDFKLLRKDGKFSLFIEYREYSICYRDTNWWNDFVM
ncbi:hypothetical protein B0O99DRAFT_685072 [Bisporella sp. PMI_857]|nr:hypothetical protein B0O99DRAFT_685072 [Bisporella sp. PMI_857]